MFTLSTYPREGACLPRRLGDVESVVEHQNILDG